MSRMFDHENLDGYRAALAFLDWLEPALQKFPKSLSMVDQLDRASTSIPLHIAGDDGKFTGADRCRFFDIAPGSDFMGTAPRYAGVTVPAPQGIVLLDRIRPK